MAGEKFRKEKVLTNVVGIPVEYNQNSITIGIRGPVLMQDFKLLNKFPTFDIAFMSERVGGEIQRS